MKEWRRAFNVWVKETWVQPWLEPAPNTLKAFEAGFHAGVLSQTEAQDAKRSTDVVGHVVERVYPVKDCGVGDGLLKIPWRP